MQSTRRGPRFVGARRLSRYKDNSTSFDRQGGAIEDCVDDLGGHIVGWADDMDVSAAKVAPAERPELGSWLGRPDEYDGIAWQRLDRGVRSMADMADLGRWAKAHKKRLVFAEGPGGGRLELDMSSPMSELILMILAFAAQMEVQATQERVLGATRYLRSVGRWKGGRVPFGRMPVPHPVERDEKGQPAGFWLARHDETGDVVDEMVSRALSGVPRVASYHAVADWLNTAHPGLTPANHRRALKGEATKPDERWSPGMVSTFLRQPLLRGHQVINGETVRDEEGEPVLVGPPLVEDGIWRRLQAEMDSRETRPTLRRSDVHPLLGVLFCGTCDGKLYQGWLSPGPNRKEAVRQYRCAARAHGRACEKPAYVIAAAVDEYVSDEFLARMGDYQVVDVIEHPAVDHSEEIKELKAVVGQLGERIAELGGTGPAVDALMGQIRGRSERLARLEAEPVQAARRELVETGETYRTVWASASSQERLQRLLEAGARCVVGQTYRGARDVRARLSFTLGRHEDPYEARMEEIEAEELS
ncbi:recombinase family protein [Streptomyces albidoflavus]|uniref:recombinase family protein n=1 Tax=Streptomyces albidoflavus TaxID=1886 RepID=UPI003404874A